MADTPPCSLVPATALERYNLSTPDIVTLIKEGAFNTQGATTGRLSAGDTLLERKVHKTCVESTCGRPFNEYRRVADITTNGPICGDCASGNRGSLDERIAAVNPQKDRRGPWRSPTWEEDY